MDELQAGSVDSRAYQHKIDKHGGVAEFRMNITGTYRDDTLLRQVAEAVRIRNTPAASLLNNKTEWNNHTLPHLQLS